MCVCVCVLCVCVLCACVCTLCVCPCPSVCLLLITRKLLMQYMPCVFILHHSGYVGRSDSTWGTFCFNIDNAFRNSRNIHRPS